MMNLSHAVVVFVGAMGLVCGSAMNAQADTAPANQSAARLGENVGVLANESFPEVQLRGYGTVSGQSRTVAASSGAATSLSIHCSDEASAKLLCTKYLSDAGVLPGVSEIQVTTPAGQISAREVKGQGCLAAGRVGHDVTIVAAGNAADLAWLIGQTRGLDKAIWESQMQVPMWLDRWDKYSFRHYYWPWQQPAGASAATYDFTAEFDYARQQDRAGILVTTGGPLATDSADGMANSGDASWVPEEARKRNLPVDIHLGAGASSETTWFINRFRDQMQMKMPGFTGNFHTWAGRAFCPGVPPPPKMTAWHCSRSPFAA